MDYKTMDRKTLIAHCVSYSAVLHKLTNENYGYRLLFGPLPEARRLVSEGVFRSRSSFLPVSTGMLSRGKGE